MPILVFFQDKGNTTGDTQPDISKYGQQPLHTPASKNRTTNKIYKPIQDPIRVTLLQNKSLAIS